MQKYLPSKYIVLYLTCEVRGRTPLVYKGWLVHGPLRRAVRCHVALTLNTKGSVTKIATPRFDISQAESAKITPPPNVSRAMVVCGAIAMRYATAKAAQITGSAA